MRCKAGELELGWYEEIRKIVRKTISINSSTLPYLMFQRDAKTKEKPSIHNTTLFDKMRRLATSCETQQCKSSRCCIAGKDFLRSIPILQRLLRPCDMPPPQIPALSHSLKNQPWSRFNDLWRDLHQKDTKSGPDLENPQAVLIALQFGPLFALWMHPNPRPQQDAPLE